MAVWEALDISKVQLGLDDDVLAQVKAGTLGRDDALRSALHGWESELRRSYLSKVDRPDQSILDNLSSGDMLRGLSPQERTVFVNNYKSLIGLPSAVEQVSSRQAVFGSDVTGVSRVIKPIGVNESGFGRFVVSNDDSSFLAGIYRGLNVTLRTTEDGANLVDRIGVSNNIRSTSYVDSQLGIVNQIKNGAFDINKTHLVYDVETSGLGLNSGIRELAATELNISSGLMADLPTARFKVPQMNRGMIRGASGNMTDLSAFFEPSGGYINKGAGFIGDEFAQGLDPFLTKMEQTIAGGGYVVGHNVQFDIDQLFTGLRRTGVYQSDDAYKSRIDNLFSNLVGDGTNGRIVDTLQIAQQVMPGLGVDDLTKVTGKYATHSIENLLLTTNLGELIKTNDSKLFESIIGEGLHGANVDTRVTSHLLKYLSSGEINPLKDGSLPDTLEWNKLRIAVSQSAAITPVTNIADISHMSPKVYRQLLMEQLESNDHTYINRLVSEFEQRGVVGGTAHNVVRGMIRSGSESDIEELYDTGTMLHLGAAGKTAKDIADISSSRPTISYLGQEVLLTRDLSQAADIINFDDADLFKMTGNWARFSGKNTPFSGFLNKASTLFKRGFSPGKEEFSDFQNRLQKAGIPFSHLSMPERTLGAALSDAVVERTASPIWNSMSVSDQLLSRVDTDLGISRFMSRDGIRTFSPQGSTVVSMPIEVLQQAGIENMSGIPKEADAVVDSIRKVSFDPFQTQSGRYGVNLNLQLSENESQRLVSWLRDPANAEAKLERFGNRSVSELFGEGLTIDELASSIEDVTKSGRGINIGSIEGPEAKEIVSMFSDLEGTITADRSMHSWMGGLIDVSESGVIRIGGVHLNRGMVDGAEDSYKSNLVDLAVRSRDVEEKLINNRGLAGALFNVARGGDPTAVEKGLEIAAAARKYSPYALGGAAILGIGAYLHNRHKENEVFDQTFQRQPTEANSRQGYIPDSALNYGTNNMDPLATAGTIRKLQEQRYGHTAMGPDKYNHLYAR